jgi:hypothetical protein
VAKEAHGDLEDKKGNPRDDLIRSGVFFCSGPGNLYLFQEGKGEKSNEKVAHWFILGDVFFRVFDNRCLC